MRAFALGAANASLPAIAAAMLAATNRLRFNIPGFSDRVCRGAARRYAVASAGSTARVKPPIRRRIMPPAVTLREARYDSFLLLRRRAVRGQERRDATSAS